MQCKTRPKLSKCKESTDVLTSTDVFPEVSKDDYRINCQQVKSLVANTFMRQSLQ